MQFLSLVPGLRTEGFGTAWIINAALPACTGTGFLDHTLFWSAADLGRKLEEFRQHYNAHRVHTSLDGDTPSEISGEAIIHRADLNNFRWKSRCC